MNYIKILFSLILCLFLACDSSPSEEEENTGTVPDTTEQEQRQQPSPGEDAYSYEAFQSNKFNLKLEQPEEWRSLSTNPGSPFTILNIYSPRMEQEMEMPLKIHTPRTVSHVSFFPEGYGTELPNGQQSTLAELNREAPVQFGINAGESRAFMLENGQTWAYLLQPAQPPNGWTEEGFLFAQIATENFQATCFDGQTGEEVPMKDCEVLGGDDRIEYTGRLNDREQKAVRRILESIQFTEGSQERAPLGDLIRIKEPAPNMDVGSPLQIRGEARGTWFFEGSFPVVLVDKDDQKLAEGIAKAQGKWMTEDFVPFQASLEFESPGDERGYLIFKKANASGKPALDRSFRQPVIFQPPGAKSD